jgi:hypothetical protein
VDGIANQALAFPRDQSPYRALVQARPALIDAAYNPRRTTYGFLNLVQNMLQSPGSRHSRRGRLFFTGSYAHMEAYGLPLLMIHSHVCAKALTT